MAKAKTITFAIQKGGAGKTLTSGTTAYLLSQQGFKVLAIDLDSQGNLTWLLTQKDIYCDEFREKTSLEAMKEQDAMKYVHPVAENLDILTSNDLMATLPRYLYTKYHGHPNFCLHETLKEAKEIYDFIIIDSPPALSDHTINALCTSDQVVVVFETSKFCYDAIDRFLETCEFVVSDGHNRNLKVAGIITNIVDGRSGETEAFINAIDRNYPGVQFKTKIKRQATSRRLQLHGYYENPELKQAIEPYKSFVKELLQRV